MVNRLRWFSLLVLCWFILASPASAQTAINATLTLPQTEAFPRIAAYLDMHDSQGQFMHGLQASEVSVQEDDRSLPVQEFEELRPGMQVVFAINPSPSFGIRNSQGLSRYDFLTAALKEWGKSRQGSTVDDLSLIVTAGPESTHITDSTTLFSHLDEYQTDPRQATPNLDTLVRAIDIAADPTPRPGMERAVLLITSRPEGDVTLAIQSLTSRANQQGIHIFVWMIDSQQNFTSVGAKQLQGLASQTQGQFFAYSGEETIPNLEAYLEPLRSIYYFSYQSEIHTGGAHQLALKIQHRGEQIETPVQSFEFNLQPPDPAFISPSVEIQRKFPSGMIKNPWDKLDPESLVPKSQAFQVLIDFPDGRKRPLVSTTLYVDGTPVAENTKPPFDHFSWDLSQYTRSGEHILQVQAKDDLGMTGSSIEMPVTVEVENLAANPLASLVRNGPLLAGSFVVLAGAFLLLVLVLGGRIRPHTLRVPLGLRRKRRSRENPLAQPVPFKSAHVGRRLPNWINRLQWPQRRLAPKAYAFLTRLSESDQSTTASPVSITADELTFGRDPNQATLVLDDLSVEALHARMIRTEDGSFRLADEGSVAGTWINYSPISGEGAALEHGDLIHIGRVGFRFSQREPLYVRKPMVRLEETQA